MLTRLLLAVLLVAGGVILLRRLGLAGTTGSRRRPAARQHTMSRREALRILGLGEDADQEAIRLAHRRLLQKLHPDRGGSDYLAQRINEARDRLSEP